jgi:ketosteroid isomerase-like protein
MVDSGTRMRLELIELTEHREIALERARCTIEGSGGEPNSSTVVLQRGADALWRILIDDPGLG